VRRFELGALVRDDAEELVDALLAEASLRTTCAARCSSKTEGNPLFVEETVRMLAEGADGRLPIPDTVQALIAARIDGLPARREDGAAARRRDRRVFWGGAVRQLGGTSTTWTTSVESLLGKGLPAARVALVDQRRAGASASSTS
jgi:hypothetical protein